jgi:hypothetical protein
MNGSIQQGSMTKNGAAAPRWVCDFYGRKDSRAIEGDLIERNRMGK